MSQKSKSKFSLPSPHCHAQLLKLTLPDLVAALCPDWIDTLGEPEDIVLSTVSPTRHVSIFFDTVFIELLHVAAAYVALWSPKILWPEAPTATIPGWCVAWLKTDADACHLPPNLPLRPELTELLQSTQAGASRFLADAAIFDVGLVPSDPRSSQDSHVPGVVHVNVNISRLQSAPGLLQRSWMASASRWTCNGAGWWPDHHGPQRLDPNFKQKHMNHYTGFPWTFNTCNYHVCQMLPVTSHSIDRSIHLWMFPKVCAKRVYAQICHLRLKCLKDGDNQWQWSSMIIETRGPLAQDAPTRSRKHTSIKPHMWNDLKISIDI